MKYLFITLLLLTISASLARAQEDFQSVTTATIEISPEFPEPFSKVTAKAISFSFDMDRASIQWFLNGRGLEQGTGLKEIFFEIGPLGSENILKAVITPQGGGGQIIKTAEIRPQAIDLLVEAKSFIPPWYKGGGVVTAGSRIKVIAVPHFISDGARLDSKTLVYDWKIDGETRGDLSGRGRQSLVFKAPAISSAVTEISVKISSPQGNIESEARTFVETRSPELLFYERRPLEGLISSEALSVRTITAGSRLEIEAVPFFANISSLKELVFSWKFDGAEVLPNPREPNLFVVKSETGNSGQAFIETAAKNLKNILEEVSASFYVFTQ